MTHEELLAYINKDIDEGSWFIRENQYFPARSLFALRAVVELHQPDKEGGCKGCPYDAQWQSSTEEYPCETIQAIEKELND